MFRHRAALFAACAVAAPAVLHAQVSANPNGAPVSAAQQQSFEVRGKITDTLNAPIPRASVSLRPKGGTAVVAGAIADQNGNFRVTGIRPGKYTIRVVFIGYSPVIQDITLTPDAPIYNLGVAKLAPVATMLAAVTVKEEKAAMTVEPDRSAYRARDVAPAAANASEVLEHTPSVQVDQDGKVSLRGNENVVVQVNGRPTPMSGTQLASYLKSLPANVIDRIEVIPNPSAKYDPDGMAGIINIALKSNVDLGLSGAVNAAYSTTDRYNGSANVGYQAGKWTTFASGGVVSDLRNVSGVNDRERFDASNALLGTTGQDVVSIPTNVGQNFNANADYKVNARDVLSNALLLNHRSSGETSMTGYTEANGAGTTTATYARPRDVDAHGWMIDYDLAFKRTFTPRTNELSTEFRFNRARDEDQTQFSLLANPLATTYVQGEVEKNDAIAKSLTGQMDYTRGWTKQRRKLDAGWKSTARWLDRDYEVTQDALGTGTWVPSSSSNQFSFDEDVHAVYGVFSQSVKKWDLQGGLRGEYADRTFGLSSGSYPYSYASLFPSANAVYNVDQSTQAKASYSRRIRRPGSQELNPFATWLDVHNVFFGNPRLSPEYTDAYELGFTRTMSKGMVQVSPFYRRTSHVIRVNINTTDTVDTREVTSVSFENLARSNSWGSDVNGQVRLSPKFSALTGASLFKMVTDGGSTSAVGSDAVTWMARANLTSEVTSKFVLQGSYQYRAPMNIEKGRFDAMQMAQFSARYRLDGDKASLVLRANDPFHTGNFKIRAGDDKVIQVTQRYMGTRTYFLGYQRSFGRPPRIRQVAPDQTQGGSVGFAPPPPG